MTLDPNKCEYFIDVFISSTYFIELGPFLCLDWGYFGDNFRYPVGYQWYHIMKVSVVLNMRWDLTLMFILLMSCVKLFTRVYFADSHQFQMARCIRQRIFLWRKKNDGYVSTLHVYEVTIGLFWLFYDKPLSNQVSFQSSHPAPSERVVKKSMHIWCVPREKRPLRV